MTIELKTSVYHSSGYNSVYPLSKPSGVVPDDLMVAFCSYQGTDINTPSGWTELVKRTYGVSSYHIHVFYRRAVSGEASSWNFSHEVDALATYMKIGLMVFTGVIATGDPIDVYSDTPYVVDNATARGATVTTVSEHTALLHLCATASRYPTSWPADFTELFVWPDWGPEPAGFVNYAWRLQDAAGATGDLDATLNATTDTGKHVFVVALTPKAWTTDIPVITAPLEGERFYPDATIDLTASATDEEGEDVVYRWWYDAGAGDVLIGDTTPAVASGSPATYEWDTTALDSGGYKLTCKGVNESTYVSLGAEVNIVIGNTVLVSPEVDSCYLPSNIALVAKGYSETPGSVQVNVEVDTNNPPDSGSGDYQLWHSSMVPQDTATSLVVTLAEGTWYFRASVTQGGSTSGYAECRRFFVLEGLPLDSGSSVEQSILTAANKVWCVVKGDAGIVESVTNDTVAPTYTLSPRERVVFAPDGTEPVAAQGIAEAQADLWAAERESYSGLNLSLEDGMKLNRGTRVGLKIPRMDVDTILPVRELTFDLVSDSCAVTLGEFKELRTDQDALMAIAQKLQSLEKESAG